MPDALSEILAQANQIGKNRMRLPAPPNTGNTLKDFLLNALGTAPMALGAKTAPGARVTGGVFDGSTPGNPSKIHAPNSAMDLNLKMGGSSPPFNRVEGIPEVGGPANANVNNPKVNDVLSFLSKENIPTNKVQDAKSGTSYIYTENPNKSGDSLKIRIPNDEHAAGWDRVKGTDPWRFMDLGTKRTKAGNPTLYSKNAAGEKYGNTPGVMEDAIKHRFGLDLVEPGRSMAQPKPRDLNTQSLGIKETDPNQMTLDLHSKIDEVLGKLDTSKLQGVDWQPGARQPFSVAPRRAAGFGANQNFKGEAPPSLDQAMADLRANPKMNEIFNLIDRNQAAKQAGNMEQPSITPKMGETPGFDLIPGFRIPAKKIDEAANLNISNETVNNFRNNARPNIEEFFADHMKTDAGKYELAQMKQKAEKMGINTEGKHWFDLFKEMNADMFK